MVWHIGDVVRKVREARNLSRKEVAGLTKLKPGTIGRIERDPPDFRDSTLRKLAHALEVPPEFFRAQIPLAPTGAPPEPVPLDERELLDQFRSLAKTDQETVRNVTRSFYRAGHSRGHTGDSSAP